MFAGRYEYAIDDKSRVSIPAKFREILAANYDMRLVLTNLESCIVAYPYKEWVGIQEGYRAIASPSQEHRNFQRFFFSGVSECPHRQAGEDSATPVTENVCGHQEGRHNRRGDPQDRDMGPRKHLKNRWKKQCPILNRWAKSFRTSASDGIHPRTCSSGRGIG